MRIYAPKRTLRATTLEYRVHVDNSVGPDTLWYQVAHEGAGCVSNRADAALAALLIPAMIQGEDIHCDGALSERLFYNASGPLQSVLQAIMPTLHRIHIYAANIEVAQHKATGVATGFSAGVDSFCVVADHYFDSVLDSFKVTHFLYNNVGSHGSRGDQLFRERYERLRPVAERIGLPFVAINSNVDAFYKPHAGFSFQQTHTLRNASVALLLQDGIGRFLYASTYGYEHAFVGPTYDTAYSDTITLPLLSTNSLDAFSVGSEYTRVAKTLKVAEIEESFHSLDVCVSSSSGAGNCSRCWKCLRTLLTLDVAGRLETYSKVFDLDIYRGERARYLAKISRSNNPLHHEIKTFMAYSNFRTPLLTRLNAQLRGIWFER